MGVVALELPHALRGLRACHPVTRDTPYCVAADFTRRNLNVSACGPAEAGLSFRQLAREPRKVDTEVDPS